jgi:tRNA pseudouridine38-40 synthase
VRTVTQAAWAPSPGTKDEWCFDVQADAFLYRMVRRLVFIQVALAQGKVSAPAVAGALAKQVPSGNLPAGLAPAHGLTLIEVAYPEVESMD